MGKIFLIVKKLQRFLLRKIRKIPEQTNFEVTA